MVREIPGKGTRISKAAVMKLDNKDHKLTGADSDDTGFCEFRQIDRLELYGENLALEQFCIWFTSSLVTA